MHVSRQSGKTLSVSKWSGDDRDMWSGVLAPAGWGWTLPVNIQRNGSVFSLNNFDITIYKPAIAKTYYVKPTGSDIADGLTWATALRSIDVGIAKADADQVLIEEGIYTRSYSWDSTTLARSMSIIGMNAAHTGPGMVICTNSVSSADTIVWALTPAQTFTYQCTRSSANRILDLSSVSGDGDYLEYTLQASIATVEANAGSYWINGTTVYVHTFDDRVPDASIWVTLTTRNGKVNGNVKIYLENIDFVGGYAGFEFDNTGAGQAPELYLKNCKFRQAMGNGLEYTGVAFVIAEGCTARKNLADGFNGDVLNAVLSKAIFYNCYGRSNGAAGDDDNGNTTHNGCSLVIVGGEYSNNKGPNIISSAALETWLLGVRSYSSAASVAGARIDFNTGGGSGVMWMDRCNNDGSTSENGIVANVGTTIHKRLCRMTVADGGAGTVDTY